MWRDYIKKLQYKIYFLLHRFLVEQLRYYYYYSAIFWNWNWTTNVTNSLRQVNILSCTRKFYIYSTSRTDFITDLGIFIDSVLHIGHYIDYVFSSSIKLLGLDFSITFSFSRICCVVLLLSTLDLKLSTLLMFEIVSSAGTTSWNASKGSLPLLVTIVFIPWALHNYVDTLESFMLRTWHERRRHLNALLFLFTLLQVWNIFHLHRTLQIAELYI